MLDNLKKYNLILGSDSPRRKELLMGLGLDFRVISSKVDEDYPAQMNGIDIPVYLARKKAESYTLSADELLITADTIVWFNNMVFGKPKNRDEAHQMLKTLSGNKHQVITGVCIRSTEQTKVFHVLSDVYFAHITEAEITYYLDNFQPYDKAGSYGAQEWIGYVGVERIEGSYFNVMGLPVQRLYKELKDW